MKSFNFLVGLNAEKNDYSHEMAFVAHETGRRLGVDIQITYAENDPVIQSRALSQAVALPENQRPNAIIVLPIGTGADGLSGVANAAAKNGVGWAVLNRYADYLAELRRNYPAPSFGVGVDQEEIGRIQGRQISALLPNGGTVLHVMGPVGNVAAAYRGVGMQQTKPATAGVRILRGNWTEQSGYDAVKSWLRLPASKSTPVSVVAAQSDDMAIGARRAFAEKGTHAGLGLQDVPFLGIDGTAAAQDWIHAGLLTASVVVPITTGVAIEMMFQALQTGQKPDRNAKVAPSAIPPVEELRPMAASAWADRD
jgi:ABC-type sugar transport system substrate-binding protein